MAHTVLCIMSIVLHLQMNAFRFCIHVVQAKLFKAHSNVFFLPVNMLTIHVHSMHEHALEAYKPVLCHTEHESELHVHILQKNLLIANICTIAGGSCV